MPESDTTTTPPATTTSAIQRPDGENVKTYLDQLEQAVKRSQELLKTLENTVKKVDGVDATLAEIVAKAAKAQVSADSEALRAFQAKTAVEEHSNAVAKLKGLMDADAAAIAKKRTEIEAIGQSFVNLRSTSEADMTAIANARKSADAAAKTVAETSGTTTAVHASIQETKKGVEDLSQAVREESKTITSDVSQVSAAKESSAALLIAIEKANTAITELQGRSKLACASAESLEKIAKDKVASVNALVDRSSELQTKVAEYEKSLTALQGEFSTMKDKVESLLPGATSVGLASAFATQRKHYADEREKWGKIMGVGLAFLTITVIVVGMYLPSASDDWSAILRHICQRFPYLVAPLWISGYAGHQHMLATRMEEEYASKETISKSFEGYKREMAVDPDAAKALSQNVLEIIARRPGLVYEGKQQNFTPLTAVTDAIEKVVPAVVEAVAAKLKGILPPAKP